jgi:hypothetical protein
VVGQLIDDSAFVNIDVDAVGLVEAGIRVEQPRDSGRNRHAVRGSAGDPRHLGCGADLPPTSVLGNIHRAHPSRRVRSSLHALSPA